MNVVQNTFTASLSFTSRPSAIWQHVALLHCLRPTDAVGGAPREDQVVVLVPLLHLVQKHLEPGRSEGREQGVLEKHAHHGLQVAPALHISVQAGELLARCAGIEGLHGGCH